MADLNAALETYIRDVIALPRRDISSAAKSREWFLHRIANEIGARTNQPALYAERPFLHHGSYFKGTKVGAVDEFDVLVVIDSNSGVFRRDDAMVGLGLGSAEPNHKYAERYAKEDRSGVSPGKMLNWLKDVTETVIRSFGGEAPEREGQAITARIVSQDLNIDLVPAGIFRREPDGKIFYDIPRGDTANGWILTAPEDDIAHLDKIAENRANFRNVIRIAKRVAKTRSFTVRSFAIEAAVVNYAYAAAWQNQLFSDVVNVIRWLATQLRSGRVPDPFEKATNLLADVESLVWYAQRLDELVAALSTCAAIPDQRQANDRVRRLLENEQ